MGDSEDDKDSFDDVDWEVEENEEDEEEGDSNANNSSAIVLQVPAGGGNNEEQKGSDQKKRKRAPPVKLTDSDYDEATTRFKADLIRLVTKAKQVERWTRDWELHRTVLSILPPNIYNNCSRNIYFDSETIIWGSIDPLVELSSWFHRVFTCLTDDCVTIEEGRDGCTPETLLKHIITNKGGSAHQLTQVFYALIDAIQTQQLQAGAATHQSSVRYICTMDPGRT